MTMQLKTREMLNAGLLQNYCFMYLHMSDDLHTTESTFTFFFLSFFLLFVLSCWQHLLALLKG